ncbi:MAG: hypothetical protein WAM14_12215 [Candidatus Nitrosopolaris sp.]
MKHAEYAFTDRKQGQGKAYYTITGLERSANILEFRAWLLLP